MIANTTAPIDWEIRTFKTFLRTIKKIVENVKPSPKSKALEDINNEWCKHPDLRFKTSPLLTRDFCGQCHSWVYVGEKNTAEEALAECDRIAKVKI